MQKVVLRVTDPELIPFYASSKAAGADVRAAISEEIILEPGKSCKIPTGLILELPEGWEAQVRPRSGLALNYQITVLNAPGTIDADFRGEVCVLLINHGKEPFKIFPKMRIAQLVFAPVFRAEFILKEVDKTERGTEGFGHSGLQ